MNKTYKDAIAEEAALRLQEMDYPDATKEEMLDLIDYLEKEWEWGHFEEDVEYLKTYWIREIACEYYEEDKPVEDEEDPTESPVEDIETIVNNLKVGANFIPGFGVGYCRDEEDLAKMKEFIRGSLSIWNMMTSLFS